MNDQAPLYCREELSLPLRLMAALVVLLLLLPYHPLTWIATAQAGPHAGYCHTSDGPCTCSHHAPADALAHEPVASHGQDGHDHDAFDAVQHEAMQHEAMQHEAMQHEAMQHTTAHERADKAAPVPPCHAPEAEEQATTLLKSAGVAPPTTRLCGCGHDDTQGLSSAVAVDRCVLHGASGPGGPPAPDTPVAVPTSAHLQPIAVDIFRPPSPAQ